MNEVPSIRAFFPGNEDFFYPDEHTISARAFFWAALEGYRQKNVDFEIEVGTGIDAINVNGEEVEVFQNDWVRFKLGDVMEEDTEWEEGIVVYLGGCWAVTNDNGLVWDLANCTDLEGNFHIKVLRHGEPEEYS